jgi:leucyl aminopeptidase (aminopeptidase T)
MFSGGDSRTDLRHGMIDALEDADPQIYKYARHYFSALRWAVLYEEMARIVVRDALKIRSTDIVSILTFPHTIDAANAIAVECFRQGADAILNLWTDEYYRGLLEYLSEDSLREPSKFCQAFTETVTAQVNIFGLENPDWLKKVSQSKTVAYVEGEKKAHFPRSQERKIRNANLSLALVTKERAKTYGFNFGAWKKAMDEAMMADLKRISESGRTLVSDVASGHAARLTAPNGTSLSFELAARPVHLDDGIIDEDDIANNSLDTQFPTGSILTTVLETSARGKVAFDLPVQTMGVNVADMEWEFKEGKLTSITAKKNIDPISREMEIATGDKDRLATLEIGLNSKAKYGFMMNRIVDGAVTLGIGDNESLGGNNKTAFGTAATISNATLEIDGRTIIKNGQLAWQ